MKIQSPYYSQDTKNVQKEALLELYALCFHDSLNEMLYAAGKAKLYCTVSKAASHGLTIRAGGFNQKLLRLVETTLFGRKLEEYVMRPERFQAIHEALLRAYKNQWLKPQSHCSDLRRLLLLRFMPRPSEKESELKSCGSEKFLEFVASFNLVLGCEVLVSGNTLTEEVQSWAKAVFDGYTLEAQSKVEEDVVQLQVGTAVVWMQPAVDSTQSNSAVEIYFQLPGRDAWHWEEAGDQAFMKDKLSFNSQLSVPIHRQFHWLASNQGASGVQCYTSLVCAGPCTGQSVAGIAGRHDV